MNIAKNTESLSIVVQWDEVDDSLLTTYTVTWTSERDLNNLQTKTVEEQSSYTITGLTLDTVYTITVNAQNRCGTGPEYSTSVSLTSYTTFTTSSIIRPTSSISTNSMTTSSTEDPGTATTTSTVVISTTSTTATTTSHVATTISSSIAGIPTINNPITATTAVTTTTTTKSSSTTITKPDTTAATISTIVSPTGTAGPRNPAGTTSKFKLIYSNI